MTTVPPDELELPAVANERASHGAALARGTFLNAIAFLASNLRGIFTLLVARLLGSTALGIFGLAWATMDLVSKFCTLGLDYSAIAFVAKSEAAGTRTTSRRIMHMALLVSIGSSIVLGIGGFWLLWTMPPPDGVRPELFRATAVMLLALPGVTLYRVSNALSRGMAVMQHDIYSRGLTESFGLAAALLIAFALGARELAPEFAAIGGTLASGLVAFGLARRLFRARLTDSPSNHILSGLFRASAPIAIYDLLNIGIMRIDVSMLGWYVGRAPGVTLETLGIYAAAVELGGGLRKVSQIFTPIFTPLAARHFSRGRVEDAEASYGYVARWMLAILLPAVAVLALGGGSLMTLFGPGFRQGGVWVAIIGSACALNAFVGLGETVLMVRHPKLNLLNSGIAFAAAVSLNSFLIPAFGALGAAIGMFIPYLIKGILRRIEIPWVLDWRWPWRALVKPWIAAFAPLPVALIARVVVEGWWCEPVAVSIYLGAYFLAWRLIGLEGSDGAVLDQLFKRKPAAAPASSEYMPSAGTEVDEKR